MSKIKKGQESVTWLNEKGAKSLLSVFLSKAEWIKVKLLRTEVNEVAQVLGKSLLIFGSEMWYMFDFSWNIVIVIVQSGLKLYDFIILAVGVETEQDCNPFAQWLVSSCACLIELKTIWTWIGNFYAAQKQDYCSEERQNSPF